MSTPSRTRYYTPPQLAEIWCVTPETIIAHIKAGRLKAFTVSPPRCKRPRWRINPGAVAEFEERHGPNTSRANSPNQNNPKDYVEYV